jgi:L-ascorbate metabolism protein UlaG (beta-lactamase superfamily)
MEIIDRIQWLGQATVKIVSGNKCIYFDPYQIKKSDKADIVFITHNHYDHFSVEDIQKVAHQQTIFVCSQDCVSEIENAGYEDVRAVAPGDKIIVDSIPVEVVPMYNIVKTNFHPKHNNWVGYILSLEGVRIYHAGDTERIPEMKNLECDIVLMPLGQTYTMNSVEEAAEAVNDVKARVAIPIHYGLYEGTKEDALKFKDLLSDKTEVIIKEIG